MIQVNVTEIETRYRHLYERRIVLVPVGRETSSSGDYCACQVAAAEDPKVVSPISILREKGTSRNQVRVRIRGTALRLVAVSREILRPPFDIISDITRIEDGGWLGSPT